MDRFDLERATVVTTWRRGVALLTWAGCAAAAGFLATILLTPRLTAYAAPNARLFGSDAALVLNFIKPDKTADFEAVVAKLREALQTSEKPDRKAQARSWKVFRALEPAGDGSVLYVFAIDPAVGGVDYTVSTILSEAFPTEVQSLYAQFSAAYASGQNFVNLKLISALGQ
jgi:hypothetical protein